MELVADQVCPSCGNTRLADGDFCLFCGDVLSDSAGKAVVRRADRAGVNSASRAADSTEYAGFWLRLWAAAIDVSLEVIGALALTLALDFVLGQIGSLLGVERGTSKFATGMAFILILAVGSWLYSAFTESSSWRATLGKRIFGLQVVTAQGGQLSFGQATVRHLMKFLSLFCLTIGFLMSGWTKRRQALHDMPSDCLVIRLPRRKELSLLRG